MFELGGIELARPLGLLVLVLAWPWIRWSRRRSPLPWAVGGLAPFRVFAASGARRRGWPWSLLAGLSALLCAALAAAGPRRPELATLWVVDGSFSFAAHPQSGTEAWRPPAGAEIRRVGHPGEALLPEDLLDVVRLEGSGRKVEVLTDLPPPAGTPEWVGWRRQPRQGRNAALLDVWPDGDGWHVRWARWGLAGSLSLRLGEREWPLAGATGVLVIDELSTGDTLELQLDSAALGDDQPQDDSWRVPPPVEFTLPPEADERWPAALRAAWPGCGLGSSAEALRISFGPADGGLGFAADPFTEMDEIKAVATIARRLEPAYRAWHAARPWTECAPVPGELDWQGRPPAPVAWRDASRAFAGMGLLLYLISLALSRAGR